MAQRLLLLLMIVLTPAMRGENYHYFQKITADSDFTFGPVETLCEDHNGLIWFGCNNGLYHHNTVKVEKAKLISNDTDASQSFKINLIYKDNNDDLWICTEKGLFKRLESQNSFEKKALIFPKSNLEYRDDIRSILQLGNSTYLIQIRSQIFKYTEGDSILTRVKHKTNGNITYINKDENDIIYIATTTGHIYISKDNLKKLDLLFVTQKKIINTIFKDGNKYYIGYASEGIDVINLKGTIIAEMNSHQSGENYLPNDMVRKITKRDNGELWIATHMGIYVFYQGHYTLLNSRSEIGLPHRSVYSIYNGYNGGMWVGTFAGGVAYFNECNYAFKFVNIDYDKNLSIRSTVSSFCEDKEGHIWIGSEDNGGIRVYDPEKDDFIDKFKSPFNKETIGVKSLLELENNNIAIGRIFNNELLYYNYKTLKNEKATNIPLKTNVGVLNSKYLEPNLYISGRRKLLEFNTKNKSYNTIFDLDALNIFGRIWYLFLDTSHNLWICTDDGLYVKSKGADNIVTCFTDTTEVDLLKETIYTVCEDKEGMIWVGTKGKGVFIYSPENGAIKHAPNYELTKEADIYSLIQDKAGNVWYTTNIGLYRYDANNNSTAHYGTIDGLPSAHIRPNSALCTESGHLYFGSINGFTIIDPNIVTKNTIIPSVHVTDIQINNKTLSEKNIVTTNSLNLTDIKSIVLKPQQNSLSFKVISNNYIKTEKNRFKYRLRNYDDKWIEVSQNHNISFTKVPSGKYVFEVFGSNNDNVWSKAPYQLDIKILPPFYRRWFALLGYIILLTVSLYLIIKELRSKLKLKKEITAERYHSQANDLIHAERVKFFTNISHELRTPLSLIISPVRSLLENTSHDEQTTNLLKVVDRNAKRLLSITDQTLDLRLLEVGKLEPNFEKKDIIEIATDVYLCFEQQIKDQKINFSFTSDFQKIEAIIDGDMIEKIIYNLMSNAVKHTPEQGHITLTISKKNLTSEDYTNYICSGKEFTGKAIEITVRDTGGGIKPNLLPHIFERFSKGGDAHNTSSGIGLHLCKEYSEMNDGNILITSNEAIGSSFILNLPLKEETQYESIKSHQIIKHDFTETRETKETDIYTDDKVKKTFKHTVLLTEDNDDLRGYLKTFLNKYFNIITARSAEQALDIIKDLTPDILITDVSMSGMSGIELTQKLKESPEWQHIPIIVMTAHTERKYQMESTLRGADAFLAKPIEESLLLAQINNILAKQQVRPEAPKAKTEEVGEETFITKVERIIEDNLHNTQFGINNLLEILNISKSTLDRKVKAETQQNPSGFIRDIRLKNAIKLMNTNKFNIDEIATYVGFNSSSYFIRTFKSKYGITPREYKKENANKQ